MKEQYEGIQLHLSIPTNADGWGNETTDAQGRMYAERLRKVYLEIFPLLYPGAEVSVRLVPETISYNNQNYIWPQAADAPQIDLEEDCLWIGGYFNDNSFRIRPTVKAIKARLAEVAKEA